ncbi:hypothetical protein PLICRDRAFT_180663 [Plicaturopsis crispa FD-325 SS-3]|uniref:Uncharacterized protein n=1 Tax=Plicaturopsis crispa FD-325 SS-3 TaxID=944288 RepID=A0A0C9T4W3_PLICR|nr:hypothetical protein PLICRDRAFT_180663 [Plicaturopsis crispa FD-325 SS-3]
MSHALWSRYHSSGLRAVTHSLVHLTVDEIPLVAYLDQSRVLFCLDPHFARNVARQLSDLQDLVSRVAQLKKISGPSFIKVSGSSILVQLVESVYSSKDELQRAWDVFMRRAYIERKWLENSYTEIPDMWGAFDVGSARASFENSRAQKRAAQELLLLRLQSHPDQWHYIQRRISNAVSNKCAANPLPSRSPPSTPSPCQSTPAVTLLSPTAQSYQPQDDSARLTQAAAVYRQPLPDYAGGVFLTESNGGRGLFTLSHTVAVKASPASSSQAADAEAVRSSSHSDIPVIRVVLPAPRSKHYAVDTSHTDFFSSIPGTANSVIPNSQTAENDGVGICETGAKERVQGWEAEVRKAQDGSGGREIKVRRQSRVCRSRRRNCKPRRGVPGDERDEILPSNPLSRLTMAVDELQKTRTSCHALVEGRSPDRHVLSSLVRFCASISCGLRSAPYAFPQGALSNVSPREGVGTRLQNARDARLLRLRTQLQSTAERWDDFVLRACIVSRLRTCVRATLLRTAEAILPREGVGTEPRLLVTACAAITSAWHRFFLASRILVGDWRALHWLTCATVAGHDFKAKHVIAPAQAYFGLLFSLDALGRRFCAPLALRLGLHRPVAVWHLEDTDKQLGPALESFALQKLADLPIVWGCEAIGSQAQSFNGVNVANAIALLCSPASSGRALSCNEDTLRAARSLNTVGTQLQAVHAPTVEASTLCSNARSARVVDLALRPCEETSESPLLASSASRNIANSTPPDSLTSDYDKNERSRSVAGATGVAQRADEKVPSSQAWSGGRVLTVHRVYRAPCARVLWLSRLWPRNEAGTAIRTLRCVPSFRARTRAQSFPETDGSRAWQSCRAIVGGRDSNGHGYSCPTGSHPPSRRKRAPDKSRPLPGAPMVHFDNRSFYKAFVEALCSQFLQAVRVLVYNALTSRPIRQAHNTASFLHARNMRRLMFFSACCWFCMFFNDFGSKLRTRTFWSGDLCAGLALLERDVVMFCFATVVEMRTRGVNLRTDVRLVGCFSPDNMARPCALLSSSPRDYVDNMVSSKAGGALLTEALTFVRVELGGRVCVSVRHRPKDRTFCARPQYSATSIDNLHRSTPRRTRCPRLVRVCWRARPRPRKGKDTDIQLMRALEELISRELGAALSIDWGCKFMRTRAQWPHGFSAASANAACKPASVILVRVHVNGRVQSLRVRYEERVSALAARQDAIRAAPSPEIIGARLQVVRDECPLETRTLSQLNATPTLTDEAGAPGLNTCSARAVDRDLLPYDDMSLLPDSISTSNDLAYSIVPDSLNGDGDGNQRRGLSTEVTRTVERENKKAPLSQAGSGGRVPMVRRARYPSLARVSWQLRLWPRGGIGTTICTRRCAPSSQARARAQYFPDTDGSRSWLSCRAIVGGRGPDGHGHSCHTGSRPPSRRKLEPDKARFSRIKTKDLWVRPSMAVGCTRGVIPAAATRSTACLLRCGAALKSGEGFRKPRTRNTPTVKPGGHTLIVNCIRRARREDRVYQLAGHGPQNGTRKPVCFIRFVHASHANAEAHCGEYLATSASSFLLDSSPLKVNACSHPRCSTDADDLSPRLSWHEKDCERESGGHGYSCLAGPHAPKKRGSDYYWKAPDSSSTYVLRRRDALHLHIGQHCSGISTPELRALYTHSGTDDPGSWPSSRVIVGQQDLNGYGSSGPIESRPPSWGKRPSDKAHRYHATSVVQRDGFPFYEASRYRFWLCVVLDALGCNPRVRGLEVSADTDRCTGSLETGDCPPRHTPRWRKGSGTRPQVVRNVSQSGCTSRPHVLPRQRVRKGIATLMRGVFYDTSSDATERSLCVCSWERTLTFTVRQDAKHVKPSHKPTIVRCVLIACYTAYADMPNDAAVVPRLLGGSGNDWEKCPRVETGGQAFMIPHARHVRSVRLRHLRIHCARSLGTDARPIYIRSDNGDSRSWLSWRKVVGWTYPDKHGSSCPTGLRPPNQRKCAPDAVVLQLESLVFYGTLAEASCYSFLVSSRYALVHKEPALAWPSGNTASLFDVAAVRVLAPTAACWQSYNTWDNNSHLCGWTLQLL